MTSSIFGDFVRGAYDAAIEPDVQGRIDARMSRELLLLSSVLADACLALDGFEEADGE
ncbi:hypothetical protein ACFO0J_01035 [Castellaniella hirudinis]|uniref:Uncharacterized protein n=1 Tax=Castellaniella hirudinis TaxID=1144617 RepID=A0ABV8RTN0_9BURK